MQCCKIGNKTKFSGWARTFAPPWSECIYKAEAREPPPALLSQAGSGQLVELGSRVLVTDCKLQVRVSESGFRDTDTLYYCTLLQARQRFRESPILGTLIYAQPKKKKKIHILYSTVQY